MYAKDRTTIIDRREMLRVKVKALAAEASIIRKQELRTTGALREELYLHRTLYLRVEARATHLAYGFVRGKTREQMEPTRRVYPLGTQGALEDKSLLKKVDAMVRKYGSSAKQQQAEQPRVEDLEQAA